VDDVRVQSTEEIVKIPAVACVEVLQDDCDVEVFSGRHVTSFELRARGGGYDA
jgi:hypothetical protein